MPLIENFDFTIRHINTQLLSAVYTINEILVATERIASILVRQWQSVASPRQLFNAAK
jgi:hypothetical protein